MNRMHRVLVTLTTALLFATFPAQAQDHAPQVQETKSRAAGAPRLAPAPLLLFGALPVSTRSPEARKYAEAALDKYENVLLHDSLIEAHHAIKADRNFAFGYALLGYISRSAIPDQAALNRARALMPLATPDEQMLIRWMVSVQDRNLLPAISSMNDLLKRYPKNKHILYLTSTWLYDQQDFDRSQKMMEAILQLDPKFPPVLNMLGYSYIETGLPNPERAVAVLKLNIEVDPTSPNPQDSLAEILRYTADDQGSLEHYNAALQLDPTFFTSQLGLGDTDTLMGRYEDARQNYEKAILLAENDRDLLHALFQKSLVYFWEGRPDEGRKALAQLDNQAAAKKEPNAQFEIAFGAAMLAGDFHDELEQLRSLELRLQNKSDAMTGAEKGENLAKVLCEEARIASQHGLRDQAEQAISKLAQAATQSGDLLVGTSYETARGYSLLAQGDLSNAADELSSSRRSPLATQVLASAQQKSGDKAGAGDSLLQLKYDRAPTVEWYLATHGSHKPL